MLKRILLSVMVVSSFTFAMSASVVQSASKDKLGCIKGLGLKRVNAIVKYRANDKIDTLDELLKVKGIGKAILKNIKNDTHKQVCTNMNPKVKKKVERKKKNIKAE